MNDEGESNSGALGAETRILYVDDDAKSRLVLKMVLKNRLKLADPICFEDSVDFEARVQALNPRPNVVFLDIRVKPLDGLEMLAILRHMEAFQGVRVVALTASVMVEELQMLRTAGFDGCLSKPLDLDAFPDQFRRIMGGEMVWGITV